MIRFVKPEEGLLEEVQRTANLDWENLKADIEDWFGETKRTLAQYVPPPPLEDDEQDNIQENGEDENDLTITYDEFIRIIAADDGDDGYSEADTRIDTRISATDE